MTFTCWNSFPVVVLSQRPRCCFLLGAQFRRSFLYCLIDLIFVMANHMARHMTNDKSILLLFQINQVDRRHPRTTTTVPEFIISQSSIAICEATRRSNTKSAGLECYTDPPWLHPTMNTVVSHPRSYSVSTHLTSHKRDMPQSYCERDSPYICHQFCSTFATIPM